MNYIHKLFSLLVLIGLPYLASCQVKYHLDKDRRLDSIECHLNDSEDFSVQFDNKGRVNKVLKYKRNQLHGFAYYLTKNKLDSIRRYDKGQLTPEVYTMQTNGKIEKHVLLLGQERDSTYGMKNGRIKRWPPFPLSMGINTQIYELDSNGYLIRIYDQDILHHYTASKYDVHFSSSGSYISKILTFNAPEEVMFMGGELSGLYSYQTEFLHGFRLYFDHYPKSRIKRVSILGKGKKEIVLYFKKNGRLKTATF